MEFKLLSGSILYAYAHATIHSDLNLSVFKNNA